MSARLRSLSLLAASALTCSISFGQSLAIGAIGGVRATDDMAGVAATSVSGRYVVGPQLDIGLPFSFGIEVDALYRHLGYNASYGNGNYTANLHERAHSWEFPMLLKYRLPFPLVKPFVEAGYAPRVIQAPTGYSSFPIPTSPGLCNRRRRAIRNRPTATRAGSPLHPLEQRCRRDRLRRWAFV